MNSFGNFYYQCICAELAKSSRSECKECGKVIEQDTLRVGHTVYFDEEQSHVNRKWMHPKCVKLGDTFKGLKVWDIEGVDDLSEKYHKVLREQLHIPQGDKSIRVIHKPKVSVREYKKVDTFEQQKTLSKKEWKTYTNNKDKYSALKVSELKELLTKNNSSTGGAKDAMVNRCALASVIGVHPNCPSCGGQNLRFYFADAQYYCPGYLDDTDWQICKTWFKFDEINRTDWKD